MSIAHWLLGPQTIGIIALLAGLIQQTYPPKAINSMYGYRTATSMRNQDTWDEGNTYSARLMIRFGLVCLALGVLFVLFTPAKMPFLLPIGVLLPTIAMPIILIRKTEGHLKMLFGTTDNK